MADQQPIDAETYARIDELLRIGSSAVAKAQEESQKLGVPNVYSINGRLYYELPNGELSRTDPFVGNDNSAPG